MARKSQTDRKVGSGPGTVKEAEKLSVQGRSRTDRAGCCSSGRQRGWAQLPNWTRLAMWPWEELAEGDGEAQGGARLLGR